MHTNWDVTTFVDLDDTLFSSKRRHAHTAELQPAATLENGDVISYSSHKQRFLQSLLHQAGRVIPVTARNIAAYRRVMLRFEDQAVLSHGATILRKEGDVDRQWQAQVYEGVSPLVAEFDDLMRRIQLSPSFVRQEIRSWLVYDGEIPVYAVVKDNQRDELRLTRYFQEHVSEWLGERSHFRLHANGNNIAILPTAIRKESAVAYLMEELRATAPEMIFVGAGDSITDEPFMRLCDFSVVPRSSQLAEFLKNAIDSHSSEETLRSSSHGEPA